MIIIVSIYFIIGGIATAIVNKQKPAGSKARWIKYIVYLIIVALMLAAIEFHLFLAAASIIAAAGLYEVVRVGRNKTVWIGLLVYVLIATGFILFAKESAQVSQFMLYVTILTFDGFSQISGQLFGQTKLAPGISPGKTIEGLAGGFIIAVATAFFIWDAPYQGIIICVAGLTGDLLASFYKRKCGVKDYSNLIPGHGGVLDRFDSLIFAGATWLLIY